MRIVVLTKPVPDPASAGERLLPDGRLDRANVTAVVNGNDEYALEAALKLTEARRGEVHLLTMAPANAPETMRKALAMGATSGTLVTDTALEGSVRGLDRARPGRGAQDPRIRPRARRRRHLRRRRPAWSARRWRRWPGCRYLVRGEDRARPGAGTVRVRRISPTGYDVLEAPMPALITCTQALGEPRYPSLKGIMAARSKDHHHGLARGSRPRRGRGRLARSRPRRSSAHGHRRLARRRA